jgi:hypothetical protein
MTMAKDKTEMANDNTVLGQCGNCPATVKATDDIFFIGTLNIKGQTFSIQLCADCLAKPYFSNDRIIKKMQSQMSIFDMVK